MTLEGIARILKMHCHDTDVIWVGEDAARELGLMFTPNVDNGKWMAFSAKRLVAAGGTLRVGPENPTKG